MGPWAPIEPEQLCWDQPVWELSPQTGQDTALLLSHTTPLPPGPSPRVAHLPRAPPASQACWSEALPLPSARVPGEQEGRLPSPAFSEGPEVLLQGLGHWEWTRNSRKRQSPALHWWAHIHIPPRYSYTKIYFLREYHSFARGKGKTQPETS